MKYILFFCVFYHFFLSATAAQFDKIKNPDLLHYLINNQSLILDNTEKENILLKENFIQFLKVESNFKQKKNIIHLIKLLDRLKKFPALSQFRYTANLIDQFQSKKNLHQFLINHFNKLVRLYPELKDQLRFKKLNNNISQKINNIKEIINRKQVLQAKDQTLQLLKEDNLFDQFEQHHRESIMDIAFFISTYQQNIQFFFEVLQILKVDVNQLNQKRITELEYYYEDEKQRQGIFDFLFERYLKEKKFLKIFNIMQIYPSIQMTKEMHAFIKKNNKITNPFLEAYALMRNQEAKKALTLMNSLKNLSKRDIYQYCVITKKWNQCENIYHRLNKAQQDHDLQFSYLITLSIQNKNEKIVQFMEEKPYLVDEWLFQRIYFTAKNKLKHQIAYNKLNNWSDQPLLKQFLYCFALPNIHPTTVNKNISFINDIQINQCNLEQSYKLALVFYHAQEHKIALQLLNHIIEQFPNHINAQFLKLHTLMQLNDTKYFNAVVEYVYRFNSTQLDETLLMFFDQNHFQKKQIEYLLLYNKKQLKKSLNTLDPSLFKQFNNIIQHQLLNNAVQLRLQKQVQHFISQDPNSRAVQLFKIKNHFDINEFKKYIEKNQYFIAINTELFKVIKTLKNKEDLEEWRQYFSFFNLTQSYFAANHLKKHGFEIPNAFYFTLAPYLSNKDAIYTQLGNQYHEKGMDKIAQNIYEKISQHQFKTLIQLMKIYVRHHDKWKAQELMKKNPLYSQELKKEWEQYWNKSI